MIVDCQSDLEFALMHDVFDRQTGENLGNRLAIWYADDDKGFYRAYKVPFEAGPDGGAVWEEFAADIEIREKPQFKAFLRLRRDLAEFPNPSWEEVERKLSSP